MGDCANVRYAGSPLALSFSERDYKRSVQLVEFDEKGRVQATRPCLIRPSAAC